MRRPTIFLSSTIYDFHDLRSALKDYLELRGCTVYASDYNDFAKDLEPHSYDACLKAIEQADLFVLLIGSRVGGLVDKETRKSITRAEYERAYELAQQGRIRIVAFVRDQVWTHRESLKEMERFLKEDQEAQQERPVTVTSMPTKFMTDATTTIAFIELVSRNADTSKALKGEGALPINNWLHPFRTFGEIRAVLDPLIFAGLDVPQAAGRAVLYSRLTTLLQDVLIKGKEGPITPINRTHRLVASIGLTLDRAKSGVELDIETWSSLISLCGIALRVRMDPAPLVPFLSDPLLLAYDPATGTFRPTDEHAALDNLIQAIAGFNLARDGFKFTDFVGRNRVSNPPLRVDGFQLSTLLHILLRWSTVASLSLALARAMGGKTFELPTPLPRGPFVDQEAGLAEEQLTADMVRAYVERS